MRSGDGAQADHRPAERLDLLHGQAELILQRTADGQPARAGDVKVGAAAAPVADREHLVRGEQAEPEQRDGHPDHRPHEHVGRRLDAQGHQGQTDQHDQRGHGPLADVAPAALRHQRVQHPHQGDRQGSDLHRRHRPTAPTGPHLHPEGTRPVRDQPNTDARNHQLRDDHQDDQMTEASQHPATPAPARTTTPRASPTSPQRPAPPERRQARCPQPGRPPHDRVIDNGDRDGGPRTPLAKTTIVKPTSTTVAVSQPAPLVRR